MAGEVEELQMNEIESGTKEFMRNLFCIIHWRIKLFNGEHLLWKQYECNLKSQFVLIYFSSGFWLDAGSIFPFDLLLIYRGDISVVRLNRLLKSYRFNHFIDRTQIRTNWPNAFKIFVLIMTCIVLFHWNAAAYFLISVTSGIDSMFIHLIILKVYLTPLIMLVLSAN